MQAHPWFGGVEWEKLYQMEAAFIPEVNDELDTQNFEKFEEVRCYSHAVMLLAIPTISLYRLVFCCTGKKMIHE
jgi:serine/threonine kinase 38